MRPGSLAQYLSFNTIESRPVEITPHCCPIRGRTALTDFYIVIKTDKDNKFFRCVTIEKIEKLETIS